MVSTFLNIPDTLRPTYFFTFSKGFHLVLTHRIFLPFEVLIQVKKSLDVLYVCDVIIKINVRYVIINRFLRYIQ